MALKKKVSKEKQLYKLDVFVDYLNLHPGKILDGNVGTMTVRVKFPDLTTYDLNPARSEGQIENRENSETNWDVVKFRTGKSCLFAKAPDDFLKSIKQSPLSIEVHPEKPIFSKKEGPICASRAPIPQCFCDQIIAGRGKPDGLPSACLSKNVYNLTDSYGREFGTVSFSLRLCCLGSSVVKHFSLQQKPFEVYDIPFDEDIGCPNFDTTDKENEAPAKFALRSPKSPPRISMDDPGFDKLTTAEKLNDPRFRNLVYKAYPNEPTCFCQPTNRSRHPLECRSGCNRRCCMRLRNPGILLKNEKKKRTKKKDDANDPPEKFDYCVNGPPNKLSMIGLQAVCYDRTRLRGGGDVKQIYVGPAGRAWNDYDTDYGCYDDKMYAEQRLEGGGGGEEGKPDCCCSKSAAPGFPSKGYKPTPIASTGDPCKPKLKSTLGGPQARCFCPGKATATDSDLIQKGTCTKKPCMGVDCLIRAFREAQDFVDSLGRVPGLAGLGLMDPSESPFFGRDIDKEYQTGQEPSGPEKRRGPTGQSLQNPYCSAPCATQISKPDSASVPYTMPAPLTISVPGRVGVVREALPALPDTSSVIASSRQRKKEEKKEEKIEKQKELEAAAAALPMDMDGGPCGEPKCRSRPRRRVPQDTAVPETTEPPTKKSAVQMKGASTMSLRTGSKFSERSRHPKLKGHVLAGGGDRGLVGRAPTGHGVKVSKRVMRYVYTIGDVYPGINYGHKNCIEPRVRVPANMGWLWNTRNTAGNLKPRLGWRPGAIARFLNEMLKEAKAGSSMQEAAIRPRSVPSRSRKPKAFRSMSFTSVKKMQTRKESEDVADAPPTLHVHRKDGTYYVTMYPIKQETDDEPKLQEPMKPLQFKIVKNKDDASAASSSTASDMEIEFSPPAAMNKYRRKPDVIHVDTQVRQQEILDAFKPTDSSLKRERRAKKEAKEAKEAKESKKGRK